MLHLRVSAVKAKMMQRTAEQHKDLRELSDGGQPLQNMDHFKYMGSTISNDGAADRDAASRIQKTSSAFRQSRVFFNLDLKVSTKVSVYVAVYVPTLLYGCET